MVCLPERVREESGQWTVLQPAHLWEILTTTVSQCHPEVHNRPRSSVVSPSPSFRLLKWPDVCVLVQKKCTVVYERVQKGYRFTDMLFIHPCIENDTLPFRRRTSGTVKVLSWVMESSVFFRVCSSEQSPEKSAEYHNKHVERSVPFRTTKNPLLRMRDLWLIFHTFTVNTDLRGWGHWSTRRTWTGWSSNSTMVSLTFFQWCWWLESVPEQDFSHVREILAVNTDGICHKLVFLFL